MVPYPGQSFPFLAPSSSSPALHSITALLSFHDWQRTRRPPGSRGMRYSQSEGFWAIQIWAWPALEQCKTWPGPSKASPSPPCGPSHLSVQTLEKDRS